MKKTCVVTALALCATALAGCEDLRAEQQAECAELGGVYHVGEDADDDACAITRENVILFDNREQE